MSIKAFLFAAAVALPASAAITPYDARYDLELTTASSTTGPRALDGILEYRVARACSGGWETRSRVMINAVFRDDTTSANERIFTSWESDDGTQYRFAVQTSKNGVMVESVRGNAKLGKKGGEAVYEATAENGQKIKVPLPRDTFLPVAYQEAVLNRAARGEVLFSGVVLNGSSTDGPRVLSTSIGPRESDFKAAGSPGSSVDPQLLGAGWPMSLAFFRLFEKSDSPIFETAMHQHESGVADEIKQTFSDFSISAHLARLKRVPKSDCARS
jgi:hypothetical protein